MNLNVKSNYKTVQINVHTVLFIENVHEKLVLPT